MKSMDIFLHLLCERKVRDWQCKLFEYDYYNGLKDTNKDYNIGLYKFFTRSYSAEKNEDSRSSALMAPETGTLPTTVSRNRRTIAC